ncbi:MAG: hypothetical protein ACYC7E_04250 [Armatimonadota bacterium]
MNAKQRAVLIFSMSIVVLMGVFPPYLLPVNVMGVSNFGEPFTTTQYAPIWNPPYASVHPLHFYNLDMQRLIVQWMIVVLLGMFGVFLLRENKVR